MRLTPVVLAGSFVLLFAPITAAETESFACHSWEIFEGTREGSAVGASTDDTATYWSDGSVYVVSDGVFPFAPGLLSVWLYQESNGMPGLQRQDEACDETNGEFSGDIFCVC